MGFISLVRKYSPKSLNQTSASSRKIKAKQGANCFIFFANDPSLFSVLQKSLRPERLHCTSPNHDLSPESSALASRGVVRVLLALVRPWGKTRKMQSSPPGEQAHPWLLKRWCSKRPVSSAPFPSLAIEVSGWSWRYFPGSSQVLWYLPIQSSAGKRSQLMASLTWLCDVGAPICLHPQPSGNTTTLPLQSTSSPSWKLLPLCLPKFPRLAAEQI